MSQILQDSMDPTQQDEARLDDPSLSWWEKSRLQALFAARFLYDNLVLVVCVTLVGIGILAIALWTGWQSEYNFIEQLVEAGA